MPLDNLEFRTPISEWETSNSNKIPTIITPAWQRRLKSLWAYVQGIRLPATLDFPNTASGRSSALTVNVSGAALGDFVNVSPAAAGLIIAGSFYQGFVSASGVVTVLFVNQSAAAIDPPSGLFQIQVTPQ